MRPTPAPGLPDLVEVRLSLRTMGTAVTLALRAPAHRARVAARALAAEAGWLESLDRRLSRFRPDSELGRLNARAGSWCLVSELLFSAVEAAVRAQRWTAGLFDPAVLVALEAWGYDRDYRKLEGCSRARSPAPGPAPALPAPAEPLCLNPLLKAVYLPPGVRVDLGGIVKGLAADTAARRLSRSFPAVLVDAGGDLAAWAAPGLPPWRIGLPVAAPGGMRTVAVHAAGVATSSTTRRWLSPWGPAHHLMDPRTGRPASSGVAGATVFSPSAAWSEVLAKALVIAGPQEAARACAPLIRRLKPRALWWAAPGEVQTWP